MLINTIMTNELDIYVPAYMRYAQIQKIIRDADTFSPRISGQEFIDNGIVSHKNLCKLNQKPHQNGIYGDWDNLIGYLSNLTENNLHDEAILLDSKLRNGLQTVQIHMMAIIYLEMPAMIPK